jgi:HD-like signal output (HDOD) protein
LGSTAEHRRVWTHSVATAWIAQTLAGKTEMEAQDAAYTTGLLHDLGRLGLLKVYGKKYVELLAAPHEDAAAMRKAEQAAFGLSHCEAGYWLAKTWDIPDALQLSILEHHRAPGLTSVACQLANAAGYPCIPYERPVAVEDLWSRLSPNTSAWLAKSFGTMQEDLRLHLQAFV